MSSKNIGRAFLQRTRGSRSRKGKSLENVPSLKEFVHRQSVVRQYRGFLRAVKKLNDATFEEQGRNEIRQQFDSLKYETDKITISMAVKEGERKLKELKSLVGYSDYNAQHDDDSWLNIKDKEDPRGRVGENWPWNK